MDKIIQKMNRGNGVGAAAFLISGSYLASRILGLLRDRLLASHFGIGPVADAYTAAFRLPDLLFTLLVSGAFAVAFIPVLTEHWVKEEREEAWDVSSAILNLLMIATLVLGVIAFIFAGPLTKLITPGFDPFRHQMTVNLTRIMMITPFFFAISSVLGSIQQSFNRFFFYAIASVFYNVGIIFGILFLSQHYSIYGVAIGVVIGTVLQAGIQIFGLFGLGYRYKLNFQFRHPSVLKVIKLMIPRSLDQGIDQINYTVQTIIGSGLATGSLTAYYYANNLKNVPLNIFGSAIATAAFPKMAAHAAAGNRAKLIEEFVINSRLILYVIIPAVLTAVLMRDYIVRLLFGFANHTTASLLGWFAAVILFQSVFFMISRVFYALQDTKTPLYTSMASIVLNIVLSIGLSRRFGVTGLPMAQSAATVLETVILGSLLKKRLGTIGGKSILKGIQRMILAGAIMGLVMFMLASRILPLEDQERGLTGVGPKFIIIMAISSVVYLGLSYLLQLREARQTWHKMTTILKRPFNLI